MRAPDGVKSFGVRAPIVVALVIGLIGVLLVGDVPVTHAWSLAASSPLERASELRQPGIRGVTIGPIESSQQPGRGYGTAYTAELLDHLVGMGVNWISITPFGRLWSLSSTDIQMDFEAPYEENRVAIKTLIRQAKARGIRVLLIPHLWVETGGWRGEIDPGSERRWQAYKDSYHRFVLAWARDAAEAGADAFSIGVECKSWSSGHEQSWSKLIAAVREVFPGLLTYSANWDEAGDVVFWHELDAIGINAFYPLADHDGATDEEYRQGAARNVEGVAELSRIFRRPVVFVEIGYTTRANAAVEPWLWPDDMQDVVIDEREQARALAASLEAFLPHAFFEGFFIWRYYANLDDISQEAIWGFSPHAKEAEGVLREVFASQFGVDPEPWPWLRGPRQDGGPHYPFGDLFSLP